MSNEPFIRHDTYEHGTIHLEDDGDLLYIKAAMNPLQVGAAIDEEAVVKLRADLDAWLESRVTDLHLFDRWGDVWISEDGGASWGYGHPPIPGRPLWDLERVIRVFGIDAREQVRA